MRKNNGKDKYRKKKYTPTSKSKQDSFSERLVELYQRDLKVLRKYLSKYKTQDNSQLSEEFRQGIECYEILMDACKKGVKINLSYDIPLQSNQKLTLAVYDCPGIGIMYQNALLHKDYPEVLEKFKEKRNSFIKKERAIKSAVKLLCNLPPISENIKHHPDTSIEYIAVPDFNNELIALQSRLKIQMDIYLDFLAIDSKVGYIVDHWGLKNPRELIKKKYKSQKYHLSNISNESIVNLVDKFIKIGYSDNEAYKRTGKLLHYFNPLMCPDPDHNIIRQRYTYLKKKHASK